jgi:hypothetical protein
MEPRVDLITLGVDDLAAARRFYVDGLGWTPVFEVPGEVVFIQVGWGLLVGLFGATDLDADIGGPGAGAGASATGPAGGLIRRMTLAHNVAADEAVIDVLASAEAAGARILKPAQRADFGGFHGYFADPDGFVWEVAHNPGWHVDPDGTVRIGSIER